MKEYLFKDRINFLLLVFTTALLPIIYLPTNYEPIFHPRIAFLLISTLTLLLVNRNEVKLKNPISYIVLITYLYLIISALAKPNLSIAIPDVLRWSVVVNLYFIFSAISFKIKFKALKIGFTMASFLIILLVITQLIPNINNIKSEYFSYYLSATMGHKNLMASALFICMPFILTSFISSQKIYQFFFSGIIFIALIGLIILSQSRSTWLALLFFLITMSLYFLFKKEKNRFVYLIVFIFISISSIYLAEKLFIKSNIFINYEIRIASMFNFNKKYNVSTSTINERIIIYNRTLQLIKEKPILGHGPGKWKIEFPKYGLDKTKAANGKAHFQRPHNDFLWILSENGIIGCLLILLLYFLCIRKLVIAHNISRNKDERDFLAMVTITLLGYIIISFFDFPKERPFHIYGSSCLLFLAIYQNTKEATKKSLKILPILLSLSTILLLIVACKNLNSELLTTEANREKTKKNYKKSIRLYNKAKSHLYTMDIYSIPIDWYIGELHSIQGHKEEAFYHFKEANNLHPNNLQILNNLGALHHQLGNNEESLIYFKKAHKISPTFIESNLNLAIHYFKANNLDLSTAHLFNISPDYNNQRYTLLVKAIYSEAYKQANCPFDELECLEEHKALKIKDKFTTFDSIVQNITCNH